MKKKQKKKEIRRKFLYKTNDICYKNIESFPKYLNQKTGAKQLYNLSRREKQKIKIYYGNLSEKHFKIILAKAYKQKDNTYKNFLQIIESRLDIILHRAKFTQSLAEAQQWIKHELISVNKKKNTNYNTIIKPGDSICVIPKIYEVVIKNIQNSKSYRITKHFSLAWNLYKKSDPFNSARFLPYMETNVKALVIKIIRQPINKELNQLKTSIIPPYLKKVHLNFSTAYAQN